MMPVIYLEILAPVPTSYRQCPHCETLYDQSGIGAKVQAEIMSAYPADVLADHCRLSAWIAELSQQYGAQIMIRLIDPLSGLGLWKALRYWIRRYPAFVVNGKEKYSGWDQRALAMMLQRALTGNKILPPSFPPLAGG